MSDLFDRISHLSSTRGLSIAELAEKANITRASLYNLKQKKRNNLSVESLCKIADVLNCSIDYLVGRSELKERTNPILNAKIENVYKAFNELAKELK